MGKKLLAIDYGLKRVGLAVADEGVHIAFGLCGIDTSELKTYLSNYLKKESVATLIIGYPKTLSDGVNDIEGDIQLFISYLKKTHSELGIERVDERLTSVEAKRTILESGLPRAKRRNKYLIDEVSATLILQNYLDKKTFFK